MKYILILLLLPITVFAQSENDKISTEQPDQSYGADVMKKKEFQFETSVYYNSIKENPNPVISTSLLRYGLAKNVEIRLLAEQGDFRDVYISETAHSTYPLAFGTKIGLVKEQKYVPGIAVVAYLELPFTNFDHQNSVWAPGFVAAFDKHLSDFTITLNGGIKEEAFEHKWEYMYTTDLKYEISEKVQVFAEYFGEYEKEEAPIHNVDSGLMFLINKKCQVHLAGGMSLAHHPSYYFINSGIAFKL